MGRVLWTFLGYKKESEWIDHLQNAKRRFLLLPSRASDQDTRIEEKRYRDEAAQSMMLDSFFVEKTTRNGVELARYGGKGHLSAIERENLEIAMNVQPFNRYLCVNILNDLIRGL